MSKQSHVLFLSLTLLLLLVLISTASFNFAMGSTQVGGPISIDTSWTLSNSPYSLTSPVIINNGATLTIEPGVTVNLYGYNIQVNGILYAKGTSDNKVVFADSGSIAFTASSASWNEQTGKGCILEYCDLMAVSITTSSVSPKISHSTIAPFGLAITVTSGGPIITDNHIQGDIETLNDGAPTITNNYIAGGIYGTGFLTSTPFIVNNTIVGGLSNQYYLGEGIMSSGQYEYIANNTIYGCAIGIDVYDGTSIIRNNLIVNNTKGITMSAPMSAVTTTIEHNTIANNVIGITTLGNLGSVTISYNNIVYNNQYRIAVNVPYNWWGTADQQAIAQMHSNHIIFTPFLTAPDTTAPPIPSSNQPLPTPSPTPSVTPTALPTPTPTPSLSPTPTTLPTISPTISPTPTPTTSPTPTYNPTTTPTSSPMPSTYPTANPTTSQTTNPITNPSQSTTNPTTDPTIYPTQNPTTNPTVSSTQNPTLPTPSPSAPELSTILLPPILVLILCGAVAIKLKKKNATSVLFAQ